MLKLLIIGAGGGAREVLCWARTQSERNSPGWFPYGFLDRNPAVLHGKKSTLPILGDPDAWKIAADEVFVCGIGNPAYRLPVCERFSARAGQFVSVIDPRASVDPTATIGLGTVIYPGVLVGPDVVIEPHAYLNMNSVVGHDAQIGAGAIISPCASVLGGASVGRGSFVGTGAVILPGKKVGSNAVVGAGAIVTRDVPDGATVVGNPARSK